MFKHTILIAAVAGMVLAMASASQGMIVIANPGFEYPVLADDDWDYSMDDGGWGYYNNDGSLGPWNPTTADFPGEAPEGENVGWAEPGANGPGGFAQVLAATLTDATYVLTVEVGNALTYSFPGYAVQLLAGGTPHTPGDGSNYTGEVTGGTLLAEDYNTLTIAEGTFETSTVTYAYDPVQHAHLLGEPLQIRLLALPGNGEVYFDDVRLIPEPASVVLLALGGLGLILRRKRG